MFDMASVLRRLEALEARSPASLRVGHVVGIGENATVRVQFSDGQGVVSALLPTLQRRVLKDQEIKLPDIGEPVAVLFSGQGGGQETGVILGAVYSPVVPDPKQEPHLEFSRFEDGTTIFYDRKNHKLYADVKGDIEVKTTGNANLAAGKAVTIIAQNSITLKSGVAVELNAPFIKLGGVLSVADADGKPGRGILSGTYTIINGSLNVPDNDVTAGGVRLTSHKHSCQDGGTGSPGPAGSPSGG